MPYKNDKPRELLTQANSILGFNQCSLAKYLFIAEDVAGLDIDHVENFLSYCLERVDFQRDLHFQTQTTMDTLDYSAEGLNEGSKLIVAVANNKKRSLCAHLPSGFNLVGAYDKPKLAMPGVICVSAPAFKDYQSANVEIEILCRYLEKVNHSELALVVICDDSEFTARSLNNFLWTTFTRSNPSHDVYGVRSQIVFKHWGCEGPLVIDARLKPHMAEALREDPSTTRRVDQIIKKDKVLSQLL